MKKETPKNPPLRHEITAAMDGEKIPSYTDLKKDRSAQLREERGKIYGDPRLSHENIGLAWTGLLQQHYGIKLAHPIPAHLAELMMVNLKTNRAAKVFNSDSYADAHVFLDFAEEAHEPCGAQG